jgi:hypothetical protein
MSPKFWMSVRQAILMIVDAIERELDIKPRTAKLRDFYKAWKDGNKASD